MRLGAGRHLGARKVSICAQAGRRQPIQEGKKSRPLGSKSIETGALSIKDNPIEETHTYQIAPRLFAMSMDRVFAGSVATRQMPQSLQVQAQKALTQR